MDYIEQFNKYVSDINAKYKELFEQLSKVDSEQDDILHFLELETYDAITMMKTTKKLKVVREKRRQIKNELSVIQKIHDKLGCKNIKYVEPNTYTFKTDVLREITDKTKIVTKRSIKEE